MSKDHEGSVTEGAPVDWEVLARFMAGESPADEADAVRAWLAENPARHDVLRALDRTLDRAAAPASGVDVEAALRRVHARMDAPGTPAIPLRPPARRAPARSAGAAPWLRIAAAVLLLIAGFFAWQVVRGGGSAPLAYSTGVGQRDSVRLPDGTSVLLGPASRLTLAADYGRTARRVELHGEALFDVPHDQERPFTVRAGGAWVRDIGTTFSVEADSAAGVRVVVTSGAVAVRATEAPDGGELVLREGDRGRVAAGQVTAERAAATADDLAWTRGRLVFRDAPLEQVAADLRRWHGIHLRAGDAAVAGRRLTASFDGEPPEQVVRVIGLALGAEVTMRGDTAVLRAAPGATP
ncbi:MAG: FecR domain-containing protein [Gemmatimonadetes bacterium]|nr:FecR domain-containing protein [Gemmatimonadota bacterium]